MSTVNLRRRFHLLWQHLGLDRRREAAAFREIALRHNEFPRTYHTLRAVRDQLVEFDRLAREFAQQPDVVRLAIWFRHLFHEPFDPRNEERSADLAGTLLYEAGGEVLEPAVRGLILITRHADVPRTLDEEFMADIDLAVLGQSPEIFDAVQADIWCECRHTMTEIAFRRKQWEWLEQFLAAPSMYWTDFVRVRYQTAARTNLERYLRKIKRPRAS